jgi:hypothetical protein
MISFHPEDFINLISPRTAMWISAKVDLQVPNAESQVMFEPGGDPKKLAVIEGYRHQDLYLGERLVRMMALTTDWFKANL